MTDYIDHIPLKLALRTPILELISNVGQDPKKYRALASLVSSCLACWEGLESSNEPEADAVSDPG